MTVQPSKLASAIAAIYGFTTPLRKAALLHLPCPNCNGRQLMTICPNCNGFGKVMEIR